MQKLDHSSRRQYLYLRRQLLSKRYGPTESSLSRWECQQVYCKMNMFFSFHIMYQQLVNSVVDKQDKVFLIYFISHRSRSASTYSKLSSFEVWLLELDKINILGAVSSVHKLSCTLYRSLIQAFVWLVTILAFPPSQTIKLLRTTLCGKIRNVWCTINLRFNLGVKIVQARCNNTVHL